MRRHLRILELALATLRRHAARTLVVVVVYAALVCLFASLLLYLDTQHRETHALLAGAPELVVQRLTAGRHELVPVDRVARIAAIRGVGDVVPRVWGYQYDPPTGATLTLWGAESVPAEALDFHDVALGGVHASDSCFVGYGFAERRFLDVGDRLPMRRSDGGIVAPRIRGVFASDSAVLTNDLVVMPAAGVREMFGIAPELCTDIAVEVHNPREIATVARKIQEMWPDVRTISRSQTLRTYDAAFDWRGGVWAAVLMTTLAAFAILVWDKATGLSAEEYRTVGLLKAVGWSTRDVLELKFWEGAVVSMISILTGVIAAEIHLLWFRGALFAPVVRGWSVLFPTMEISPALGSYTLLLCLPLAVVPYVGASLIPSWRAAITDPDSVMRT